MRCCTAARVSAEPASQKDEQKVQREGARPGPDSDQRPQDARAVSSVDGQQVATHDAQADPMTPQPLTP